MTVIDTDPTPPHGMVRNLRPLHRNTPYDWARHTTIDCHLTPIEWARVIACLDASPVDMDRDLAGMLHAQTRDHRQARDMRLRADALPTLPRGAAGVGRDARPGVPPAPGRATIDGSGR